MTKSGEKTEHEHVGVRNCLYGNSMSRSEDSIRRGRGPSMLAPVLASKRKVQCQHVQPFCGQSLCQLSLMESSYGFPMAMKLKSYVHFKGIYQEDANGFLVNRQISVHSHRMLYGDKKVAFPPNYSGDG